MTIASGDSSLSYLPGKPTTKGNIELLFKPGSGGAEGNIRLPNGTSEISLPAPRSKKSLGIDDLGNLTTVDSSFGASVIERKSSDAAANTIVPGGFNSITEAGNYNMPSGNQGDIVILKNFQGHIYNLRPAAGERIEAQDVDTGLRVNNASATVTLQYTDGKHGWLIR